MPCACLCNDRTARRQCGLTAIPRYAIHRCACSECGHSGCHVRIEWSEIYCWVCEGGWHADEQKAETDEHVQRPKKKRPTSGKQGLKEDKQKKRWERFSEPAPCEEEVKRRK